MQDENPEGHEQADAKQPTVRSVTFSVVCIVHGTALLLMASWFPGPDENPYFLGAAIGIVFSQASIAAGWFTLGWPGRNLGVPSSIFFPSLAFLFYASRTGAPPEICILVAAAASFQFAYMLVPILLTKRLGWSLEKAEQQNRESKLNFEIRHIMLWTTGIAVLLAIGRTAIPQAMKMVGDTGDILLFFLLFSTGNIVLAGPLVWTIFSASKRLVWFAVLLFALCSVAFVEQFLLGKIKTPGATNWVISLTAVAAYTTTFTSALLPLRLQGWVLIRNST
ncbi:MAG: hypothetical protein AAF394_11110 [Planctomycetota bacterium]